MEGGSRGGVCREAGLAIGSGEVPRKRAADTTFRWNLSMRALGKESPYNRFWGQMIRWLASQENMEKKTGASVTAMLAKE